MEGCRMKMQALQELVKLQIADGGGDGKAGPARPVLPVVSMRLGPKEE